MTNKTEAAVLALAVIGTVLWLIALLAHPVASQPPVQGLPGLEKGTQVLVITATHTYGTDIDGIATYQGVEDGWVRLNRKNSLLRNGEKTYYVRLEEIEAYKIEAK